MEILPICSGPSQEDHTRERQSGQEQAVYSLISTPLSPSHILLMVSLWQCEGGERLWAVER